MKRLKPYIALAIALTAVFGTLITLAAIAQIVIGSSVPLAVSYTAAALGLAVYVAVILREE